MNYAKTSNQYHECRKCLPTLCAEGRKKGHTKAEVDEIICWLTGHLCESLKEQLEKEVDFETFFAKAPGQTLHGA